MGKIKKWFLSIMIVLGVIMLAPEGAAGLKTDTEVQAAVLETPKLISVKSKGTSALEIKWKPVKGADGYRLYSKVPGLSWQSLITLHDGSETAYTDVTVHSGYYYMYTVRAYKKINGKTYWSDYNHKGMHGVSTLEEPEFRVNDSPKKEGALEIWISPKVNANGYVIYRKNENTRKWERIAVTHNRTFTDTKVKKGHSYTYTVKAYKTLYGKNYFSEYNKTGISHVVTNESLAFTKLKYYIMTKGKRDFNKNKYLTDTARIEGIHYTWYITYRSDMNKFELKMNSEWDEFSGVLTMYFGDRPSYLNVEYTCDFYFAGEKFKADSRFRADKYNGQKLNFTVTESTFDANGNEVNELASFETLMALAGCEDMINQTAKVSLTELGFKSLNFWE